jgi:hypothetical protein
VETLIIKSLRTTWEAVEVEGVITSSITLDSVGFLARDPVLGMSVKRMLEQPAN